MVVLAVGPHPGDCEVGCFGTLARLSRLGHRIVICALSNGSYSETGESSEALRLEHLSQGAAAAAEIGATFCCFDFNEFYLDAHAVEQRQKLLELMRALQPELLITQAPDGTHPDYQACHDLVVRCSQELAHDSPLYLMERPGTIPFVASDYVSIDESVTDKLQALERYPHRSEKWQRSALVSMAEAVQTWAKFRGLQCNHLYAEAFQAYPGQRHSSERLLP